MQSGYSLSIANFYISPWHSSLLSFLAFALLSLACFFFWRSGQLLRLRTLRSESLRLKSANALQQLRIIGPKLCWGAVLLMAGWGVHDIQEYHSTYVLANAAVEAQRGVYLSYHYVDDPERESHGMKFCEDYVPDLQPRQIIKVMVYVRKRGCESIAAYKSGLSIRRINGVPILEGE